MDKIKVRESNLSDEEIVRLLRDFMGEFRDTEEEIRVALSKSRDGGYVLEALNGDGIVGLAVVLKLPYEPLFPAYHMTYVATHPDHRREGIGQELIKRIIALTGGDISLHVSPRNAKAINLYKKAGFEESYIRMMSNQPSVPGSQ